MPSLQVISAIKILINDQVSDSCSQAPSQDASGPLLRSLITKQTIGDEWDIVLAEIVPDDVERIQTIVKKACDDLQVDVVLTTGGTGFGNRDVTPESVTPLLHKQAPGFVVAMLTESLKVTPFAMLARPVAGVRGHSIIITLPGSPKGAKENLLAIWPTLGHAIELARGGKGEATHAQMAQPNNFQPSKSGRHSCPHKSYPLNQPMARRPRESPFEIVSVDVAHALILKFTNHQSTRLRPTQESLVGYVCAEDVVAMENVPAFRASIVDGYALHSSSGPGVYPIARAILAGSLDSEPLPTGTISRINTGAPVPDGADAVVMVEYTTLVQSSPDGKHEESIEIHESVKAGENIRETGSDCAAGTMVFAKGDVFTLAGGEVGILASIGNPPFQVYNKPKVGVMSTGTELVNFEHDGQLKRGQVRDSNRPTLLAAIESCGFEAVDYGIRQDDPLDVQNGLKSAVQECDVVITTGGVSMGEADYLKQIIEQEFNGQIHFGRVHMKPGKPTTFATINDKPIFALPGNPVSAIVTFYVFVLPALRQMAGYKQVFPPTLRVKLDSNYTLDPRPEYVRAHVAWNHDAMVANITGNQRSSRLLSMKGANALLKMPAAASVKKVNAGDWVDAIMISNF